MEFVWAPSSVQHELNRNNITMCKQIHNTVSEVLDTALGDPLSCKFYFQPASACLLLHLIWSRKSLINFSVFISNRKYCDMFKSILLIPTCHTSGWHVWVVMGWLEQLSLQKMCLMDWIIIIIIRKKYLCTFLFVCVCVV